MTTILIFEGNSPDLVAAALDRGDAPLADYYGAALKRLDSGLMIRTHQPYDGAPADFAGVDGIVFTGSGVEWCVMEQAGEPQAVAMRGALDTGLPVFGSCNGMQLAAYVLGGQVGASPNGTEDGIARDLTMTEAGKSHPMLSGRTDGYAVPCVHRDEVQRRPEGATLLAGNAHSPIQAFAYETGGVDFWGVQYHPEYTPNYVARGLFRFRKGSEALQADLNALATDPAAAARLGTTAKAQQDDTRMIELKNWLVHVKSRNAG